MFNEALSFSAINRPVSKRQCGLCSSITLVIIHTYTAISIYVVGSKLRGYGTRPKGGMGRLELILGFRGCRREMDMEAENTISIANISFIQMARHRRSSLYGRGIVDFADNYSLRSHIPLRSCLVGLRLRSDNVN